MLETISEVQEAVGGDKDIKLRLIWVYAPENFHAHVEDAEEVKKLSELSDTVKSEWDHYHVGKIVGAVLFDAAKMKSEKVDSDWPWTCSAVFAHQVYAYQQLDDPIPFSGEASTDLKTLPADVEKAVCAEFSNDVLKLWNKLYDISDHTNLYITVEQPYAEFLVSGVKDIHGVPQPLWVESGHHQANKKKILSYMELADNKHAQEHDHHGSWNISWCQWLTVNTVHEMAILSSVFIALAWLGENTDFGGWMFRWFTRGVTLVVIWKVHTDYVMWVENWKWRAKKTDPDCPSHFRRPDLPSFGSNVHAAARRFSDVNRLNLDEDHVLCPVTGKLQNVRRDSDMTFVQAEKHRRASAMPLDRSDTHLDKKRAKRLDMDHLWMSLTDFMWAQWFVGIPVQLNAIFGNPFYTNHGLLGLVLQDLIYWLTGWSVFDFSEEGYEDNCAKMAFEIMMENTGIVWVTDVSDEGIARMKVPSTTRILADGHVEVGDLICLFDCEQRRIKSCHFNEESLCATDALVLLMASSVFHTHPILHSFSNWMVNTDYGIDAFTRRMGLITVKFNNLGMVIFSMFVDAVKQLKIIDVGIKQMKMVLHLHHTVPHHGHGTRGFDALHKLAKYSKWADFVLKLRPFFLLKFEEHSAQFPDVDGEALFIGTVLHSLDHRCFGDNASIPVVRDLHRRGDPNLHLNHQIMAFTLATSICKSPYYIHNVSFKKAGCKFFREVYEHAATINKRFADKLDCAVAY